MWRMKIVDGDGTFQYLEAYDLEYKGVGAAWTTDDPAKAMTFASAVAVLEAWRQQSRTNPLRPDGRPNRPLTAFTIEPERIPEGERDNG